MCQNLLPLPEDLRTFPQNIRPINGLTWQVNVSGASPGKSHPCTCQAAQQLYQAHVQVQNLLPRHACRQQNVDKSNNDD